MPLTIVLLTFKVVKPGVHNSKQRDMCCSDYKSCKNTT